MPSPMISLAESYYLFRHDGLDGPYSPVQLRLMVEQGLANKSDYCQPEDGGPTRLLREIIDDPHSYGQRPGSSGIRGSGNSNLDPFASGDVPMMGDTLPLQSESSQSDFGDQDDARSDSESEPHGRVPKTTPIPQPEIGASADTREIYHGHPSYLSYGKSMVVASLLLLAAVLTLPLSNLVAYACAAVAALILIAVWADRSFVDYVVTSKRVEVITGMISRSSHEVKISDIRTINVVKNGFLGLLGVGNVEFASAGGDEVEVRFEKITGTQRIKKAVRALQDG